MGAWRNYPKSSGIQQRPEEWTADRIPLKRRTCAIIASPVDSEEAVGQADREAEAEAPED